MSSHAQPSTQQALDQLLSEIRQQPDVLRHVRARWPHVAAHINLPLTKMDHWVGLAEGSSYNALSMAAPFVQAITNRPMTVLKPDDIRLLLAPSSFTMPSHPVLHDACFLVVSQSGETGSIKQLLPELVSLLHVKDTQALPAFGMTNAPGSSLNRMLASSMVIEAGLEQSIAATKSVSASLMALLSLALEVSKHIPNGAPADMRAQLTASLDAIPDYLAQALNDAAVQSGLTQLAAILSESRQMVLLSEGVPSLVLPEASLKLTETSSNWVVTDTMESFKHGRTVMLFESLPDQRLACVYCVPTHYTEAQAERFFALMETHHRFQFQGRSAAGQLPSMLVVRFENSPAVPQRLFDSGLITSSEAIVTLPHSPSDRHTVFLLLVVFQWLSALVAQCRGVNPNHPSLQKAITT